jgi:hypothetical protein
LKDDSTFRRMLSSSSSSSRSSCVSMHWEPVLPVAFQDAWADEELVADLVFVFHRLHFCH